MNLMKMRNLMKMMKMMNIELVLGGFLKSKHFYVAAQNLFYPCLRL